MFRPSTNFGANRTNLATPQIAWIDQSRSRVVLTSERASATAIDFQRISCSNSLRRRPMLQGPICDLEQAPWSEPQILATCFHGARRDPGCKCAELNARYRDERLCSSRFCSTARGPRIQQIARTQTRITGTIGGSSGRKDTAPDQGTL